MNTELAEEGTAAPEDKGTSPQVSPCRKPNGAIPALHKPTTQHNSLRKREINRGSRHRA